MLNTAGGDPPDPQVAPVACVAAAVRVGCVLLLTPWLMILGSQPPSRSQQAANKNTAFIYSTIAQHTAQLTQKTNTGHRRT